MIKVKERCITGRQAQEMKAVRKGQMGDFLPACQELMTAKLADESEDILSILLVEIAKCNNRI